MRAFTRLCEVAAVAVVVLALSSSAQAQRTGAQVLGLETIRSGVSVAGLVGVGFEIEDDFASDLNPYGLGLGVRGGYTLPDIPFYAGGTFIYHLGDSARVGSVETSLNYSMLGGEFGYDVMFDQVTIRPYLGLGAAIVTGEVCESALARSCGDESNAELYFSLGGSLLFYLTQNVFLGGDMRLSFVTDAPDGIQFFGTGGAQF